MAITTDNIGLQPVVAPVPQAPGVRPPVQAPTERGNASGNRRESKNGRSFSFREALNAAATDEPNGTAGLRRARGEASTQNDSTFVRAVKIPAAVPRELSADEATGQFHEVLARQVGEAIAATNTAGSDTQGFFLAASRYAERVLASSDALARPGESLEVTA